MIVEIFRAHMLSGYTNVCGVPDLTFKGWIERKSYKIENIIKSKDFYLKIYSHEELLLPFAYDINRMATSSFESISGIEPERNLPKSTGWLIIRAYYSAYFAAHAILRLFGISCSLFDRNAARAITEVANLYGMKTKESGKGVDDGYFFCEYDFDNETIRCTQLDNSHKGVWKTFYNFLGTLATKIPNSDFLEEDKQETINYIYSLREGLSCKEKFSIGNWLSVVRNKVNYSHAMGAWYPYNDSSNEHESMFRIMEQWKSKPSISLIETNKNNCDHLLFASTCVSIVSLCHSLLTDLHKINNNTFLAYSPLRFINQISGT